MNKTWEGISERLHRQKKNLKAITALKDLKNNNKLLKEASQFPNILNEHFASVGNMLAGKMSLPQQHYLDFVIVSVILLFYLFFFNLLYRRKSHLRQSYHHRGLISSWLDRCFSCYMLIGYPQMLRNA